MSTLKFDGVDLQTHAFNIATFGGRTSVAARRGDNLVVPYRHGRLWTPKYFEEQELTLAMWVIGADKTTGVIPSNPKQKLFENIQTLQKLFSAEGLHTLSAVHEVTGATVEAIVEVADVIDFTTMAGATRAGFVVTLIVPEVWFKDQTLKGDVDYVSRANNDTWSVDVTSDVETHEIVLSFDGDAGGQTNPKLINESIGSDCWVQLSDVLGPSEVIVIDVNKWTAVLNGTTNVVNNVDWSGQPRFFRLKPGTNNLKLEVGSGPIKTKLQWKGLYW